MFFSPFHFQVASTTLDASAKIYAGRVDAIHAETYKVLTGLGRSGDKPKTDEDGRVLVIKLFGMVSLSPIYPEP